MRILAVAALAVFVVGPALAQTPAPETPPPTEPPAPTAPPPAQPPTTPPPAPAPVPPPAQGSRWQDRMFIGGGVGLSFGDIDYVEISPIVGYRLTERITTGLGVFYRWKSDDRFEESVDTSDWGASLFGRLALFRGMFGQVEYEYVDYEYATLTGTSSSDDTNLLAGLGISRGGRAGFYALALYNFSYDEDDPFEPYDSPWVYRVGVSFGF